MASKIESSASASTESGPWYTEIAAAPILFTILFGGIVFFIVKTLFRSPKTPHEVADENKNIDDGLRKDAGGCKASVSKKSSQAAPSAKPKQKDSFDHPLLVATLRGHTDTVCDAQFNSSGKYLVSCGEDRSLHIWTTSDFLSDTPAKEVRNRRLNVELDHASLICFSPDTKALLAKLNSANRLHVYKLLKKPDGHYAPLQKALELPENSAGDIVAIDISSNGKFILTAYENGQLSLWSLKGDLLSTVLTNVPSLREAKISPCGRLLGVAGSTQDVKVFAVTYDKISGDYQSVAPAFDLKGHSAVVPAFAFSGDSTHMASVSKDRTFRLYDINVQFKQKEDPRLVSSAAWIQTEVNPLQTRVAVSNDSHCVAISHKDDVYIFSGISGQLKVVVNGCVSDTIDKLLFDPSSGFILAVGGKIIRLLRNVYLYEINVELLREKLKYVSQDSVRQRLQQQLEEAEHLSVECQKKYSGNRDK